jgi:hypothetical protein
MFLMGIEGWNVPRVRGDFQACELQGFTRAENNTYSE